MGLIPPNTAVSDYIHKGSMIIDVAVQALMDIMNGSGDQATAEEAINQIRIHTIS
jgi:hypothetical protein